MKNTKQFFVVALFATSFYYAQESRVGVNTTAPKTTMDINGKTNASGVSLATDMTGLQAPRLTRAELTAKGTIYGTDQKGALVYITNTDAGNGNADPSSPRKNVTSVGYYYFDGEFWMKINSGNVTANNGLNMPTASNAQLGGTLLKNTEIEMAGFNTAFTGNGNIGIGVPNPSTKLHIESTANPLTITGVQAAAASDELLTVNSSGVVRKTTIDNILSQKSIPTPAVWTLTNQMNDFLNGVTVGNQVSTPMQLLKNDIPGLTFDAVTNTITFPSGLYQMTYVYEALHNNTGCTISSYFVDFPDGAGTARKRVHSTSSHNQGALSNHGGNITYTAKIPNGKTWQIRLGRGQSGNCLGPGNELYAATTQFNVVRLGDQ